LTELASCADDEEALSEFLAKHENSDYWTKDQQGFEQLKEKLRARKITEGSSKAKELLTIPYAAGGMCRAQTHIVYASKTPITGKVFFDYSKEGFAGYADRYGNIIMSVGVDIGVTEGYRKKIIRSVGGDIGEVVENRGIFRNPPCVVEGGYGRISTMLHSFTCMVVEDYHPSVKIFRVHPLKQMGEILMKSLPKKKITVDGIRGDLYDKGFDHEREVLVPVKVFAGLHR
jgi:hypothetical protein